MRIPENSSHWQRRTVYFLFVSISVLFFYSCFSFTLFRNNIPPSCAPRCIFNKPVYIQITVWCDAARSPLHAVCIHQMGVDLPCQGVLLTVIYFGMCVSPPSALMLQMRNGRKLCLRKSPRQTPIAVAALWRHKPAPLKPRVDFPYSNID